MRVISYNIWNGFEQRSDAARHAAFIDWMQQQDADVVALQELCGYDVDTLRQDAAQWGHDHAEIVKTGGYPVGITAREPITVRERLLDGLWHGMLHAEVGGCEFFVVHLSPADVATRHREALTITRRVRALEGGPYLLLGDFNAHSPVDTDIDQGRPDLLEKYRRRDRDSDGHLNLCLGEFDYSVLSTFLGLPAIDVVAARVEPRRRFSFPAPALVGKYDHTPETIVASQERIDFILASPDLAARCTAAVIVNDGAADAISDHFPVIADFDA